MKKNVIVDHHWTGNSSSVAEEYYYRISIACIIFLYNVKPCVFV